jgi:chromosome partitioning protein
MQVAMVYSESGGVTKSTTATSLAMVEAENGKRVVLIDLDPRAASTHWVGVDPVGENLDVGAILGNEDPEGWAKDLAVPSGWHDNLRVIPSARSVSIRESEQADYAELRLKSSLVGLDADLVIIDCPNRQGGPLTLSALNASDLVIYASKANEDGVNGVEGARLSVERFKTSQVRRGLPDTLHEAGVIIGEFQGETIQRRIEKYAIAALEETSLLLYPLVPARSVVQEVRASHEWYGKYRKGAPVVDSYRELARKVFL